MCPAAQNISHLDVNLFLHFGSVLYKYLDDNESLFSQNGTFLRPILVEAAKK